MLQTIALPCLYESEDGVIMKSFDVAKSSIPIKNPFDGFGALLETNLSINIEILNHCYNISRLINPSGLLEQPQ
jgi:hypothetical protein